MTPRIGSLICLLSSVVSVTAVGCAGADEEGAADGDPSGPAAGVATRDDALTRHRRLHPRPIVPRDAGTATGGVAGTSGAPATGSGAPGTISAGCEVCEKANACCNAVDGGALCTFSAATCESLALESRAPYVNACLTLLDTVASVRTVMPNACR